MARRQQEKSQETQKELLAAALELFQERGFFDTTIAHITERAGYAKGSFYRHWQGKDEITLQLIEAKLAGWRAERNKALERAENLEQALEAIWDFLEAIMRDKSWARLFLEFTVHASGDQGLKTTMNRSVYRLSDAIFADMVTRFVDSDFPPEKLGALNTCLFEGFLIHGVLGTGTLSKEDIRAAAKRLLLSLASGDAEQATQPASDGR